MAPRNWQQVKNTFHDALRLESAERGPFLDKACNDDIEFRIEVESLLISLTEAKSFLEQPIIGEIPQPDSEWRLKDGEIISHYRIVSPIASGGMGEVYLAEDEKLGRRVALKILPEAILADRNRLLRFRREAEVISALNHPNILTIFEFGDDHDVHFFASEFVKGETLRARLRRGRLSLHDALEIAMQIASALRAAHDAGIIHRDIKPENVMIRDDGYVKVLDFGLAKLTERVSVDSGHATKEFLSQPGVIMGTVSYMSPEQARARSTDARSDLFSFGVVLFEMLTGHIPFDGETTPDVIAGIIQAEPRTASSYNGSVPDEMDRIITKCLEKDRDLRYQTAADLLADLKRLSKSTEPVTDTDGRSIEDRQSAKGSSFKQLFSNKTARSQALGSGKNSAPSTAVTELLSNAQTTESKTQWNLRSIVLPALAIFLIAAAAGGLFWQISFRERSQNPLSSMRIKQLVGWNAEAGEGDSQPRFSPNGSMIALSLTKDGKRDIWTKQIPDGRPNPITDGKENYYNPIWSPDGQRIAFVSNKISKPEMWEVPFSGGAPSFIWAAEGKPIELLRWSKDGAAIYFRQDRDILAIDLGSRQVTQLTRFDSFDDALSASISADEDRIAYSSGPDERRQIFSRLIRGGGEPVQITSDDAMNDLPIWLADSNRVIYSCRRGGIFQICVARANDGATEQINLGISDSIINDVSADGSMVLFSHALDSSDLWRIRIEDGKETRITSDVGLEVSPDLSPDGTSVVYQSTAESTRLDDASIIMVGQVEGGQHARIASNGFFPSFSPDGRKVAFSRFSGDKVSIWTVDRNGSGEIKLDTEDIAYKGSTMLPYNRLEIKDYSWSADGRDVIFGATRDGVSNLWRIASDGGSPPRKITDNLDTKTLFSCPLLAPDGVRIAFTSSVPAPEQKLVTNLHVFEGESSRIVFSSESAFKLLGWSKDGSGLLIAMPDKRLSAKPVNVEISLISKGGNRTVLASVANAYYYNVRLSPDGRRLALAISEEGKEYIRIISMDGRENASLNPRVGINEYISGVAWSPDGKALFFGKQKKENMISVIENLK